MARKVIDISASRNRKLRDRLEQAFNDINDMMEELYDGVDGEETDIINEQIDDRVAALIQDGTGISWSYNDSQGKLTPTVSLSPFTTTNLTEGTNLYYTQGRFDSAFGAKDTDDLSEGATNLYYTNARVETHIAPDADFQNLGTGDVVTFGGAAFTGDVAIAHLASDTPNTSAFSISDGGNQGFFFRQEAASGFIPTLLTETRGDSNDWGLFVVSQITPANDTGTTPIMQLDSRQNDGTAIETRPLLALSNLLSVKALFDKDGHLVVGGQSFVGSEKFRVTGDALFEGDTDGIITKKSSFPRVSFIDTDGGNSYRGVAQFQGSTASHLFFARNSDDSAYVQAFLKVYNGSSYDTVWHAGNLTPITSSSNVTWSGSHDFNSTVSMNGIEIHGVVSGETYFKAGDGSPGNIIFSITRGSSNNVEFATFGNDDYIFDGGGSFAGNVVLTSSTSSRYLKIEADTDNDTESHNPYLWLSQDGAAVEARIGLSGDINRGFGGATLTGSVANSVLFQNDYSAGLFEWAHLSEPILTLSKSTTQTVDLQFKTDSGGDDIGLRYDESGTGLISFYNFTDSSLILYGNGTGQLFHPSHGTTANAANVNITTGGLFRRSTSSLRYKEDVKTLDDSIILRGSYTSNSISSMLSKFRPIRFRDRGDKTYHIGFAAEEVHEIMPELCTYDEQGQPDWVQYPHLTSLLVGGWQKHESKIQQLQAKVLEHEKELSSLKTRIAELL